MAKRKLRKIVDLPGITGPGVAPVQIEEINELADDYINERDKRCKLTPREIAAKDKLITAIHKHADTLGRNGDGSISYRYDDMVILLSPGKEKLSVKEAKQFDDEEED